MHGQCDKAFKEWNVACQAMMAGKQTILIRKGGIREDGGRFVMHDSEFWLMPTFDHQTSDMVQPEYASATQSIHNPDETTIQAYAVIDQVWIAKNDAQVTALQREMIWNEKYVKLRFDTNPYDPLYIVLLRVYRLANSVVLPMIRAYGGCRSWVTLERSISTAGAIPAISDGEFEVRSNRITALVGSV